MSSSHFHHGHGLAGYGPEEFTTCTDIGCLASCVHDEIGRIADSWGDQAYASKRDMGDLKKLRPSNGDDPAGYPGSWESIADAAMRALECLEYAEAAWALAAAVNPGRRQAPLYRDNTAAWNEELRRHLLGSGTYPLTTTIDGHHRFYVWECTEWACLLNEHDTGYAVPAPAVSGGVVPCACRDCMDVVMFVPESGRPPYCDACKVDCTDRLRSECEAAYQGDGEAAYQGDGEA